MPPLSAPGAGRQGCCRDRPTLATDDDSDGCVQAPKRRIHKRRQKGAYLDFRYLRGCTLGGKFQVFKGRRSVILGVWAAPGARGTIPLGGGVRPPPFGRGSRPPRARPDPQNDRFPILIKILIFISPQSAATKKTHTLRFLTHGFWAGRT